MGPEKQHRFDGLVERAAPGTHEAIANYLVALGTSLTAGFCDIAAGNGALISRMRGKGFKNFVAVEWNVKDFRLADLTPVSVDLNLPFADKIKQDQLFDVVTAIEIIEHLENPRAFLAELRQVLRPGAQLLVSTPNLGNWPTRLKFFLSGEMRHFLPVDIKAQRHITPILSYQMEAALNECGFRLIRTFYCGSTYGPLKHCFMKMIDLFFRPFMRSKSPLKEVTVYHAEADATIATRSQRDYFNNEDFLLDDHKL